MTEDVGDATGLDRPPIPPFLTFAHEVDIGQEPVDRWCETRASDTNEHRVWPPSVLSSSGVAGNPLTNARLRCIWQESRPLMIPTDEPIPCRQRRPPPVDNVFVNHV